MKVVNLFLNIPRRLQSSDVVCQARLTMLGKFFQNLSKKSEENFIDVTFI